MGMVYLRCDYRVMPRMGGFKLEVVNEAEGLQLRLRMGYLAIWFRCWRKILLGSIDYYVCFLNVT